MVADAASPSRRYSTSTSSARLQFARQHRQPLTGHGKLRNDALLQVGVCEGLEQTVSVEGGDDVAFPQSGVVGGAVAGDPLHLGALPRPCPPNPCSGESRASPATSRFEREPTHDRSHAALGRDCAPARPAPPAPSARPAARPSRALHRSFSFARFPSSASSSSCDPPRFPNWFVRPRWERAGGGVSSRPWLAPSDHQTRGRAGRLHPRTCRRWTDPFQPAGVNPTWCYSLERLRSRTVAMRGFLYM